MQVEFGEVVGDQQQGFFTAFGAVARGSGNFRFHVASGFVEGFGKQGHVFVRPLYIVKRRFSLVAHNTPFLPPASAGWTICFRFNYCPIETACAVIRCKVAKVSYSYSHGK